jgi:glycerophosphoryl diester phosphodiesterase
VIAAVKQEMPELKAYWLASVRRDPKSETMQPSAEQLIETAKRVKADGLNLSASPAITKAFVDQAKAAGLPVYVWTVNDPAVARAMIEAGVTAVTTDRPGWMREQLTEK